jgi:flagellar hook protein FlgE
MGLYGVLNTGVSGMNAQSNRLGVVADNIQNQNTTGYKRGSTEFSSVLISSTAGSYNSGSVDTIVRHAISGEGTATSTTSDTDLAIKGNGFFVVTDSGGKYALTRAGNFVTQQPSGDLVNAAGMHLMGYNLTAGEPNISLNGYNGLVPVNLASFAMKGRPSTLGYISRANLDSNAPIAATGKYSKITNVAVFDNLGNSVQIDIYFTKTANNTWQVAAYDHKVAGVSATGDLPTAGQLNATTLNFDANGQLTGTPTLNVTVPNGQPFTFSLKNMSQLAADFQFEGGANGSSPQGVVGSTIGPDGTVYAQYQDGTKAAAFRVPLATVASPDQLTPRSGNVFETGPASGSPQLGFASTGGRGSVEAHMLENSNVDLGDELATMIAAQTSYGANSKVFQTGTEMLELLVNLKR